MRKAWPVMGTVVSLDIPGATAQIFGDVAVLFNDINERFSAYRRDSEVSRQARGEIKAGQLSADLADIIKQCDSYKKQTDGYFSAYYNGGFDPTGYVKGWAIARAGRLIEQKGHSTYCLSVGGDILARSKGSKAWRIGISDPQNTQKVVWALALKNSAIATSGNYERGRHILNPRTGQTANFWQSVTVINPDIIKADVWATAAFAMAEKAAAELAENGLEFLLIDRKGHLFMSEQVKALANYS